MTPEQARAEIVAAAKSQLGVPYVYGGEDPGVGMDCSGLAQWCCSQAGVSIPRGSAAQFTVARVAAGTAPLPGMLVFFYGGESSGPRPGHVGICTGPGLMIDAPYTGVDVRYDAFSTQPLVGPLDYWGATDPAQLATGPTPVPPPQESETDKMLLLECNDSPAGNAAWYTLSGAVAVHVPDVATLKTLQAGIASGAVGTITGAVSWAWLGQYAPKAATSG